MKNLKQILISLFLTLFLLSNITAQEKHSASEQDFIAPKSFSSLKKITASESFDAYLFVQKELNLQVPEINDENLKKGLHEVDEPLCWTEITKGEKYLITFTQDSATPQYQFYKLIAHKYIHSFGLTGRQLYIPGNGNFYISGNTSQMFSSYRKFKLTNGTLKEVKQPYLYVGLKTSTNSTIQIFSDKERKTSLAILPPKSDIEVLLNDGDMYLIKSSFGLLGWWKMEGEDIIEGLHYHGD